MSTFKGVMVEFPELRGEYAGLEVEEMILTSIAVDFFRHDSNLTPPLACFLSHVHSDHLAGLESFKSPL